jgi:hypothetical protein
MPSKRTTKAPRPSDRAAERADYATWRITAGADLLQRHDVKPGIIPERLWRKLYIRGMTPQKAADQAVVSANNTMSPAELVRLRMGGPLLGLIADASAKSTHSWNT